MLQNEGHSELGSVKFRPCDKTLVHTSSSNITNKRTRARSTASSVPVTTSSQTRSVSKPDQPALLLIPSGGVRLESANGLLTTAIWATDWDAISSSLRRTSGFKAGFEKGESRISDRVTLIATRCWDVLGRRKEKEQRWLTWIGHSFRIKPRVIITCWYAPVIWKFQPLPWSTMKYETWQPCKDIAIIASFWMASASEVTETSEIFCWRCWGVVAKESVLRMSDWKSSEEAGEWLCRKLRG